MPNNQEDLNRKLNYLNETKQEIKRSLKAKGQPVNDNTTFREYANLVNNITTGTDTQDATATPSDLLSPKTAYVKGIKITGNIQSEYKTYSDGMTYQSISLYSSNYIMSINEEYGIALVGNFNTTSFDIYEFKNNQLGNLLYNITYQYINVNYGNILSAGISKELNTSNNLNIYWYQHKSNSNTGYMCCVQFDVNTYTLLDDTKASISCNAISSRHVGNISVNPKYPNIVAVANQWDTINGSSAIILNYDDKANKFINTLNIGRWHGRGVTGDVCEWDSTGRYLMHFTSKLTPDYAWIEHLNETFTSTVSNIDLARLSGSGSGIQTTNTFCLWKDQYFFWNNTLRNFNNTVIKTYSEYQASYNSAIMWTFDNYLFVCNYDESKLYCFMIDELTYNLTACFGVSISAIKPTDAAKYSMGSTKCPQSNQHLYFADSANISYKFNYIDEARIINNLDFGGYKLYNPSDSTANSDNILKNTIAYTKQGRVIRYNAK